MNNIFELQIKNWVRVDNQIKILNDKLKELRENKTSLTANIMSHISTNNLTNSSIQISDGKLRFANSRIIHPLTFKYLEKTLGEIIKNDTQVKHIIKQIKEKREVSVIPEIKRIYNN